MQKGELTQQMIIEQAAQVFSIKGYAGTSMGDLMSVTGLSKGALYNHFDSKDDLAVQVFDYSLIQIQKRIAEDVRAAENHAVARLTAFVNVFRNYIDDLIFEGGCPLLNTSVEVDDTHPELRDRARRGMTLLRSGIKREISRGMSEGQLKSDIDDETTADIIVATIEGGIMMSKLYGDSVHINRCVDYLSDHIQNVLAAE